MGQAMTDDANNAAERMATSPPTDSDSAAVEPADSAVAETTVFAPVDEVSPETATEAVNTEHSPQEDASVAAAAESPAEFFAVSTETFFAPGCTLKVTAVPAEIMAIELLMIVDVGLVVGVIEPMTP